ncbi:MAG: FHA domain-containing protein [Desulfuromonadales bacterium]|nr:FHA domain-containing protein [Desulfuromonadales bacterium]
MAESEGDIKMERVCPECRYSNPPGKENCQSCGLFILFEPDTPLQETASSAAEEGQQAQETASSTDHDPEEAKCPECEAVGTIVNNRCSRCNWTSAVSFTLKWQDERISNIPISCESPVFIGRVPPVEASLAQHIESYHHTVSRMHAELYLDNNGLPFLRDMGSQNGTSVNGCRIQKYKPQLLKNGDTVAFSSSLCAQVVQI